MKVRLFVVTTRHLALLATQPTGDMVQASVACYRSHVHGTQGDWIMRHQSLTVHHQTLTVHHQNLIVLCIVTTMSSHPLSRFQDIPLSSMIPFGHKDEGLSLLHLPILQCHTDILVYRSSAPRYSLPCCRVLLGHAFI